MITKTIELYTFEELSPEVQEEVIQDNRDYNVDNDWDDFTLDEWKEKLAAAGFPDASIYYRGFSSQGDGASFLCKRVDIPALLRYNKSRTDYRRLLYAIDREHVYAEIEITQGGYYCHEYTMGTEDDLTYQADMPASRTDALDAQWEQVVSLALETGRTLARQVYKELEKEYDYLTSGEAIKESLISNDVFFTESGKIESQ